MGCCVEINLCEAIWRAGLDSVDNDQKELPALLFSPATSLDKWSCLAMTLINISSSAEHGRSGKHIGQSLAGQVAPSGQPPSWSLIYQLFSPPSFHKPYNFNTSWSCLFWWFLPSLVFRNRKSMGSRSLGLNPSSVIFWLCNVRQVT